MSLLARVKLRVPTDLPDGELTAMITAVTAELDARFGAAGAVTAAIGDLNDPVTPQRRTLRLLRAADPALPITITEFTPGNTGNAADETVLTAADFAVQHGGRTLQRLGASSAGNCTRTRPSSCRAPRWLSGHRAEFR